MDETDQKLLNWIPQLAKHSVLVVGDLFLDDYVVGHAARLSREAPIPVLEFLRRFYVPGGAANPAHNICALGGRATVIGLIGNDEAGTQLLSELERVGIDPAGVVVDGSRPTTTKTRIMAEGSLRFPQQVARVDRLDGRQVTGQVEAELVAQVHRLAPDVDAVLVSDYQTGAVGPAVVQAVLDAGHGQGKLCTVDAQGAFHKYRGFDVAKGNRQEMETTLGMQFRGEEDYQRAGRRLLHDLDVGAVLITRGAEGISLIAREQEYRHWPAANRTQVFDVTGAGDTVIAVATLALLAGASLPAAAQLANYAAGLVVRKRGNAVVTAAELAWAIDNW